MTIKVEARLSESARQIINELLDKKPRSIEEVLKITALEVRRYKLPITYGSGASHIWIHDPILEKRMVIITIN